MNDSPIAWAFGRVASALNGGRRSRGLTNPTVLQARRVIEQRASGAGRLIFIATGGQIRRTEVKFEDNSKDGYESNPVVFRCVKFIAEAIKSMPLLVFDGEKEVEETHPLRMVLEMPNPEQIWEELVEAIVTYLILSGDSFLEGVQVQRGQLMEIYALRPDRVSPVPAPDGSVARFVYEGQGGEVSYDNAYKPGKFRPILHMKNFHPRDHWRGLPSLTPAGASGDEHNEARAYAKALYQNSARPSGAMVYQPKEGPASLNDQAFERLKDEIDEQYVGVENAGRPMLLDGGLSWEQMGLSPKDLEAGEGRNNAAREIAFALGVPPLMLGIKGDNTFANFEEANLAFWRFTVWPLARFLQKKMTAWVRPLYPNARIVLDVEGSPIAEAEKKAKWERVKGADFLSFDEKRGELGFDPLPNGEGKNVMVATSLIPLADAINGGETDANKLAKDAGYIQ